MEKRTFNIKYALDNNYLMNYKSFDIQNIEDVKIPHNANAFWFNIR